MADALAVDGTPVGTDHGKPAMSTGSTRDVFGAAYRTDVTSATGPPPTSGVKAPPPAPFALRGSVLTPTGALRRAYVVVAGGLVHEVRTTKPRGVHVLETDGVIMPGMLDLHGHPEFNVFAAWEPPRRYSNRYIWRSDDLYHELVRDPQNRLLTALPSKTQLRYAEARALVGGATAIQGASARTVQHADSEPLVRNVDLWIFGQHRARSMIDLPSGRSGRSWDQLVKVLAAIEADEVDAFFLHLCEGRRDDKRSQTEFAKFIEFGAATPSTVIIHATALSPEQLDQVHDAGCKLVWSPQSNLRLYAETTLASHAISIGMDVALGADWLPSGSTSLLAELQVARRALHEQGLDLEPARLVEMVTSTAARVAGLSSKLGALAAGRPADVVVLQRRDDDPYESVCQSDPACVELVLIGGDVSYGRADWFNELTGSADSPTIEDLVAWGRPMRLDTGFQSGGQPAPSLAEVRAALIGAYPQVGPIFA